MDEESSKLNTAAEEPEKAAPKKRIDLKSLFGTRKKAAKAKKPRRKRSAKSTRRMYIIYASILLVLVMLFIYFVVTMLFNVDHIDVSGNTMYEEADIIKASGIGKGDNLFNLDLKKAEDSIYSGFSYVEDVEVKRMFPNGVSIDITEAETFASIEESDGYTLLSRGGKVLERGLEQPARRTMVARGFSTITSTEGDQKRFGLLKDIIIYLDGLGMRDCDIVDLTDTLSISVIYDSRIKIELGNELELQYKLQFADSIIREKLPETGYFLVDASTPGKVMTKELTMSPAQTMTRYVGTGFGDEDEE